MQPQGNATSAGDWPAMINPPRICLSPPCTLLTALTSFLCQFNPRLAVLRLQVCRGEWALQFVLQRHPLGHSKRTEESQNISSYFTASHESSTRAQDKKKYPCSLTQEDPRGTGFEEGVFKITLCFPSLPLPSILSLRRQVQIIIFHIDLPQREVQTQKYRDRSLGRYLDGYTDK